MASIWSRAWHMFDAVLGPPPSASISAESLPEDPPTELPAEPPAAPPEAPAWTYPQTQIHMRVPTTTVWPTKASHRSSRRRRVAFTGSTLQHVAHRETVNHGETSGFQNFVREMYEAYYKMKLDQEWRGGRLEDEFPVHNRRLSFKDLVVLQRVARDMWRRMARDRRRVYKDLAGEVKQRRRLRLPPDPYRTPVTLMGKKKVNKTKSVYKWTDDFE
ncbi:uncharacterized protein [Drosophila pseudoobscura]|uniref:Uncharacterized protein n=1 Tax=Drosophila pseudoobscura pseudoobscura TaxID=46245 RepID=A0A6I8V153_DROPS|nr:uncharacterized protein LOC6900980 [Drosophila pseudoobscura]